MGSSIGAWILLLVAMAQVETIVYPGGGDLTPLIGVLAEFIFRTGADSVDQPDSLDI